jgi:ABC-2 type transport system ATP-binding protein
VYCCPPSCRHGQAGPHGCASRHWCGRWRGQETGPVAAVLREGQILLEDTIEVNKNPVEYRLRVNYGEAEPNYPEFLTALDLIQFVGKAKKASEKQMFDLIEQLEIGSYVNNQLGTFSSGMLKKTSLVLSFLGNPSLILLDEPLITIDQKAIENMFRLVQTYQKQGVSFLLSSHQEFKVDEFTISNTYWIENRTVVLKN